MTSRRIDVTPGPRGIALAQVCATVRELVTSGRVKIGELLPAERQLSLDHGVAQSTVHRALKLLEAEGLIATEPRHGYRVIGGKGAQHAGAPVALLSSRAGDPADWSLFGGLLIEALRSAAVRRGWPLLVITADGHPDEAWLDKLRSAQAAGLIVDTYSDALAAAIETVGIPAVLINSWHPGLEVDAVMQDGHAGCRLAVRHLVARGCRRIGWFGRIRAEDHTGHEQDRLGGTVAGLIEAGRELPPELRAEPSGEDCLDQARELLSRRNRPDGIVAPWDDCALAVKRAADELGLVLGKDLEMVGWCPEESYRTVWLSAFAGGAVPPAITWSVGSAANAAIHLLDERRRNPRRMTMMVRIPTRLRLAETGG